ncbi:MAG: DUF4215 domain-containing protein, partial [Myxococcales bacterium]|nr:DUF4215 domain-containing protein [Myxococcales bacterium]
MRRIGMAHVGGWLIGAAALLCVPRAASAQIIYCGDGIVSPELSEQCDDGNQVNGDGCSSTCYIENCGDGIVGPDEQCDDGNDVDYDGCTNCTIDHTPGGDDAVCGDGVIDYDAGEQCDDGNTIGCDGCGPTCRFPYCGNGAIDNCVGGFEQCDDGNLISGDGCSATCTLEDPDPRCGNGVVDYGELCDDGNLVSGDGCSATCVFEYCGNGVVDAGEACDDGSGPFHQGDHGCDAQCQWDNTCGDGVVEPGEECDAGGLNVCNFGCCNESCHCPTCGDGVVQQLDCPDCPDHSPEQCDDGNTVDGDGCSAVCTVERCGNGVIEAGEQCDDGNTVAGDGCDAGCAAEGEPNCCSDEGGKPTFMEVRFTHPLVANATSITIDHGRKCGDFDDRDRRCGGGGGGDDH